MNSLKTNGIKNNTDVIDEETEAQKKSVVWLAQGYAATFTNADWFNSHWPNEESTIIINLTLQKRKLKRMQMQTE